MPDLVDQAFAEIAKLPEEQQIAVAAWILEELAAERRWEESFAQSADALERLADEALAEHRRGETRLLIPDEL
jgi:hypothetical protein